MKIPKREFDLFSIKWLMGRTHIGTSDLQVAKDILRRTKEWKDKGQRKLAVKYAIREHHSNQRLYYSVMRGS